MGKPRLGLQRSTRNFCNLTARSLNFLIFFTIIFALTSVAVAFEGFGVTAAPQRKAEEIVMPQAFKMLKDAGVKWARIGFKWNDVEPEKGKYDFDKQDALVKLATQNNIKVLGLLLKAPGWAAKNGNSDNPPANLENWRNYVKVVVSKYKNDIRHWEIWNEPDIKKFWNGTPEEYVTLLKEAYTVIKQIDPSIKVVSAGLDGNAEKGSVYLDKLLSLGMASYCDAIAFHPYGKTPEMSLKRVKNFTLIMQKYGVRKPLWITEIGWQTGAYQAGVAKVKDEQTKASYLKRAFQLLRQYAEVIIWYRGVDSPGMFGLLELDKGNLKPTPAFSAYKEMTL